LQEASHRADGQTLNPGLGYANEIVNHENRTSWTQARRSGAGLRTLSATNRPSRTPQITADERGSPRDRFDR
jgi:hypothetical protein